MYFNISVLVLLILSFTSCSTMKTKSDQILNDTQAISQIQYWPSRNDSLFPGHVHLLNYKLPRAINSELTSLHCNEKKIPFYLKNGHLKAFLSISYFSGQKTLKCRLKISNGQDREIIEVANYKIVPFDFPSERLNVDKKRVFLSKKDLKRVLKEKEILKKIYSKEMNDTFFQQVFQGPLNSYITSRYGTRRVYNNKKNSQHLGTDFRAKVGTEIPAANSGKVVFAGDLFYTGNTVIVYHGLKIYTVYGHLSKLSVRTGDNISVGDLVGFSGQTGRVNGPHLHWGVKVNDNWVDGLSLVSAGI